MAKNIKMSTNFLKIAITILKKQFQFDKQRNVSKSPGYCQKTFILNYKVERQLPIGRNEKFIGLKVKKGF